MLDFIAFKEKLKQALNEGLPGEDAHLLMSPLRGKSSDLLNEVSEYRKSAVGIHLIQKPESDPYFLLIRRSAYDGVHGGQISFPGGKSEITDANPEFTARRESLEEIGIPLNAGEMIGALTQVYIPVSSFLVESYLFLHSEEPLFELDSREVDALFKIDLRELLLPESVQEMKISRNNVHFNVPCFYLSEIQVWGATAIILSEFKELLLRFLKIENGQIQML